MQKCVCALHSRKIFFSSLYHEEVLLRKVRLTSDMYTYVYTYTILYYILNSTVLLISTRYTIRKYYRNRSTGG
jgi:hypothetical protein